MFLSFQDSVLLPIVGQYSGQVIYPQDKAAAAKRGGVADTEQFP